MTTVKAALTRSELRARIDKLPRMRIAHLPTPLEEMPRLSEELGGPRIFVKREDMTGLVYGGNKARHYEHGQSRAIHWVNCGSSVKCTVIGL